MGAAFAGYLNFPVQAVQRKVPAFFNPLSRALDNGRYAGLDDCEILAEIRRGFDSFDKCRRRSLEQASFAPQNILNFFFLSFVISTTIDDSGLWRRNGGSSRLKKI